MPKHKIKRAFDVTCESCGSAFTTGSSIKRHCSPECRVRDAAAAFVDPHACWEWPGSRNPKSGYGQLSGWEGGKRILYTAHRTSFRAFFGSIPDGEQVLHHCDNPACFNPRHLFSGSQAANMRDMIEKGRAVHSAPSGSKHHAAKITEADVAAIRRGSEDLATLAARYGMSKSALSGVRTGKTWKNVD